MKKITLALLALVAALHVHAVVTYINSPVTYSFSVGFNDDIVINNGGTLTVTGCTISFVAGKKIQINPGGKLIGTNATFDYTGIGAGQWSGILVMCLNTVPTTYALDFNNVTVTKATEAISVDGFSVAGYPTYPGIRCLNSSFTSNNNHVFVYGPYASQSTTGAGFLFDHCNFNAQTGGNGNWPVIFSCGYNVTFTYCTFNQGAQCGRNIHVDTGKKIRINHCTFNPVTQSCIGLHFGCDDAIIDNNQYTLNNTVVQSGLCSPAYYGAGIEFCDQSFSTTNVTNVTISNNTFTSTATQNMNCGILFPSPTYAVCGNVNVINNTVSGFGTGLSISNCTGNMCYIQKNTFNTFETGVQLWGNTVNLDVNCNSFTPSNTNATGITVTGTPRQYTTTDRMNKFYGSFTHLSSAVAWTYAVHSTNPAPPTTVSGSVTLTTASLYASCSCHCERDGGLALTNDAPANPLFVYPNPGNGAVQITIPNEGESTVHVFDPTGRLVLESKKQDRVFDLDLTQLPKGMYLLLIENNGTAYHEKIVIE